jgi:hypothetical protein
MIDRPLVTPDAPARGGAGVDVEDPNAVSFPNPDGSIDVFLDGLEQEMAIDSAPFDANLADYLPEQSLGQVANDLRFAIDEDRQSRREWEDALTKGLDLLGIKEEPRSMPWPGACAVVHPMILEAAVRFQSKTVIRLFPASGPAQAKVQGETDAKRIAQAKRVSDDLNYWLTEKMSEYRDEAEQMLFALPIDGSAFKKVYFDPLLRRPVAQFVPANDFLMPYGFPNLETCPRYTHVIKKAFGDVRQLQDIGFYRDISLAKNPIDLDRMEEKVARLSGVQPSYTRNDLITLWETTADLIIEDDKARSYVVTMESETNRILSIYRNWTEGDPEARKVISYVHYRYVPWKGPYGLGLLHLIGGIGRSSTSILRQLVDAGTLSNLPGGLKSKTLRIKGDNDPIQPGEFRDVDVPAGKIGDSIAFIPYKEPSAVLFQLLQMLVDEGKSFASIAELDIATSAQNAPVGTVLALIERATEVITAVQSRMHIGLARELTLIAEIIRDNTPGDYEYDPPGGLPRSIKEQDYHSGVSIIPVSDPAAATSAQKIMEYQAALQLSSQAPQLYDLPLLHRSMIQVLGIDNADQIVPDKTEADPMDPVAENMALLTSKPVKAFQWQDHEAHLTVHQNFQKDPKIQQALAQNPLAASIQQATFAHLNEHLAYQYRAQMEQMTGAPLPPLGSKMPAEAEEQLSALVAAASQKVLGRNMADQQQAQQQQQQQDPLVQMQQQELALKQQQAQQKNQADQAKLQLEQQRTEQKGQIEAAKIASADKRTAMQIQAENERHGISEIAESHRAHAGEHAETTRHLMDLRVEREKNLHGALDDSHQTMIDSMPAPAAPPGLPADPAEPSD